MMPKIRGFSLSWVYLVNRRVRVSPSWEQILYQQPRWCSSLETLDGILPSLRRCKFIRAITIRLVHRLFPFLLRYPKCSRENLPSRQGELEQLIKQDPDVLTEKLGFTHVVEHKILLLENAPVWLAPYRLAPSAQNALFKGAYQTVNNGRCH